MNNENSIPALIKRERLCFLNFVTQLLSIFLRYPMKKLALVFTGLAIASSCLLTACGGAPKETTPPPAAPAPATPAPAPKK